jgi:FixJ family two-component response regulator
MCEEVALKAGISKVLRKPFASEELLSAISEAQRMKELDQIVR